jgi:hypothetical protein
MNAPAGIAGALDSPPPPAPRATSRADHWFAGWPETLLAALAAAVLYVSLYGELPYHDVARFAAQINSGRFVWDIGHILLQPATLLWHVYLGFGETAEASQKHINTFATAAGIGVFHALLQWLDVPRWKRVCATAVVAASYSLIILAPSGHMKLLAFPFVNASLFMLMRWEPRRRTPSGIGVDGCFLAGAVLLALAAAFLASALATAPFAGLAVLATRLRDGAGWPRAVAAAGLFAAVCGAMFVLLACAGYAEFAGDMPSLHGLTASVAGKADLKPPAYGAAATLARLAFGTINNLIAAPDLGTVLRARIAGEIASLAPYRSILLFEVVPWLAVSALVAGIYLATARALLGGARLLMPAAFLCGAQTWTVYYGLNDPEHWFQLTVPTVILFLAALPPRFTRIALPPWAVLTVAVNVGMFGLPYAAYPLNRYEQALRRTFSANDLLISFAAYPGGPSLGFFDLPGVPGLMLDARLSQSADVNAFFDGIDREIAAALARHGRVVVIGNVLDPYDWNAPWADLPARGIGKQQLIDFFQSRYSVKPAGSIAEMKAWEILPPGSAPASQADPGPR